MRHDLKTEFALLLIGLGVLASAPAVAGDVDMWDGQLHFEVSPYLWTPFIYTTLQFPPAAGGGNRDIEIKPSQYLSDLKFAALFEGTLRKGDWALWTDLVYLNVGNETSHLKQIGLPGVDPTLPLTLTVNSGLRQVIWTLAPSYTVMRNDVGTLDILAGIRYTSVRVSVAYELTAPPTALMQGGGFWPATDFTDGIVGVKGDLRLSGDGKWYFPYEADVGAGNQNWQWNAKLGVGYHFHWGDLTLVCRNLTLDTTNDKPLEKVRLTGPAIGATFRW